MDLEVEKALQYNVLENFFSTKQITSVHPELPQVSAIVNNGTTELLGSAVHVTGSARAF